jgi:hypothetical protein
MKDYRVTSYHWNPPKFTSEEALASKGFREEMIRKEAVGWDSTGEWQCAMGVLPKINNRN